MPKGGANSPAEPQSRRRRPEPIQEEYRQEGMNNRLNRQLWLSLEVESTLGMCDLKLENPTQNMKLMGRIVAPSNHYFM